jgi:hypothetical protein
MTSPDGINWTLRASSSNGGSWEGLTWSGDLSLFVAVAFGGSTGFRVMTSPNGIDWTLRASPDNTWLSVAWSPEMGMFVAIADNAHSEGTQTIMVSKDGITWTLRTPPANKKWRRIIWVRELGCFVVIAYATGVEGNLIMLSRMQDVKQQYLSIYGRATDQTVKMNSLNVIFSGTNSLIRLFDTATNAIDVVKSSPLSTSIPNVNLFSGNYDGEIVDSSMIGSARALSFSGSYRVQGSLNLNSGNPFENASLRISKLFARSAIPTATSVVTGGNNSFNAIPNIYSKNGISGLVGTVTANGWHCNFNSILQLNSGGGASTMENFIDYNVGIFTVGGGNTLLNRYGVYINTLKQSFVTGSGFSVYQEGVNDLNYFNGQTSIGSNIFDASAKLAVSSTTQGFLPPKMTTTQRDAIVSPAAGLMIYNITTAKLNVFTTAWEQISSS